MVGGREGSEQLSADEDKTQLDLGKERKFLNQCITINAGMQLISQISKFGKLNAP
jgi:hypothetical protein